MFFLLWLGFIASPLPGAGSAAPKSPGFPSLVDKSLFASGFARPVPFKMASRKQDQDRATYQAEYKFRRTKPGQHYTCTIEIAPAGQWLDQARFESRYQDFQKAYSGRGPEFFEAEFPKIGKRAVREMAGAGPGGAAWGIVFTTTDGRFDVRVALSSLLPESVADPKWDPVAVARRLSSLYDAAPAKPSR